MTPEAVPIVLATGNAHKRAEIVAIVGDVPVRWLTLADVPGLHLPDEDGDTFEDNALIKAMAVARASGLAALADDSGLCVDALGGAPGVHSARFAGPDATDAANNRLLLARLDGVPDARRGAAFHCCAVLVCRAGTRLARLPAVPGARRVCRHRRLEDGWCAWVATGRVAGRILRAPAGAGGFGYDPLFYHPPSGRTFAQLDPAAKNAVSHRRAAFERIGTLLASLRGGATGGSDRS